MRDYTTIEVLKVLPLEKEFKKKLVDSYDTMDENNQLAVTQLCWDAFVDFEEALNTVWREVITQEVATGKRVVEGDLELEVYKEVEKDILARISGVKEDAVEISEIRKQLEKFISSDTDVKTP